MVSFRMPQIDAYPGTETVESREELSPHWIGPCGDRVIRRHWNSFIAQNTWEQRMQQMLGWLAEAETQAGCEKTFHVPTVEARA